jgi:RecA-family ATPase
VCLADVTPKGVEWHLKPFVQVSAFHLLAGQGGSGKGSWLAAVTAAMTNGKTDYLTGDPRNVIVISTEDSTAIDLVPRILAAGGDVGRVFTLRKSILLPRDIGYLEETIKKERKGAPTGLVIIDPVANHIGGKSTDDEGSVREAINNLNHVADRTNTAIIGVRHPTKYGDGGVTSVLGSGAWTHCPRVVLMMKQSDDTSATADDRVLEVVKSNRGEIGAKRWFSIQRVSVPGIPDLVPKLVRYYGMEGP